MAGATRTGAIAFLAAFLAPAAIVIFALGYFMFSGPRPSVQSHDPTSKIQAPNISARSAAEPVSAPAK